MAHLGLATEWLSTHVQDGTPVYVASYHREHPTIITGWDGAVTWLGTDSLFLPPPGQEGIVIFAHGIPPSSDWLPLLQPSQFDDVPSGPDGGPAFWAYRVSADMLASDIEATAGDVRNNFLTFIAMSADPTSAGTRAEITMLWRVDQPPAYYRLRPILTLRDAGGIVLATDDAYLLGTNQWRPGEIMMQRMGIDVPIGTPPGSYALDVTWVDRDSEAYLSYIGEGGAHAGIAAEIGKLEVVRPDHFPLADALSIEIRGEVDIAPGIRLLGWNPPATTARPRRNTPDDVILGSCAGG